MISRRWFFVVAVAWLGLSCLASMVAGQEVVSRSTMSRSVVITVDDLPIVGSDLHGDSAGRRQLTDAFLDVLERHGVKAVGLVTWSNVLDDRDLDLLGLWLQHGHELGNHSFHHRDYHRLTSEDFIADVEAARQKLAGFLAERDETLRFFRFPFLHEGETVLKLQAMRRYLEESGQRNLPVTLDNADWSFERPWVAAQRAGDERSMKQISLDFQESLRLSIRHHERISRVLFERSVPQILLLHANAVGAAQWDALLTGLKQRGYRFITIDEALADPAYSEAHEHVSGRGFGLWDRLKVERDKKNARQEIERLLAAQVAAWNRGDLEAFTAIYADDAVFISPSGSTTGRAEVLARYQSRYPDRAAMGRLSLQVVRFDPVWGLERSMVGDAQPGSVHGASVVGRWQLSYSADTAREDASGSTLLVFHRQQDGWKIVQDASM